ncbi:MAG: PIG-L family deacetylase [Paludibacteraceae bacterium]|nr:PIG-L family deacetylase [Paludibacteraceae bacterium]
MKNNLSSQIVLSRVPSKLYRTTDSLELSRLTRREKIQTTIVENADEGSALVAKLIKERVQQASSKSFSIALSTGKSLVDIRQAIASLQTQVRLIDWQDGSLSNDEPLDLLVIGLGSLGQIGGQGIRSMLNAKEVILVAWGEHKAQAIQEAIEGEVKDSSPASKLQYHKNVQIVCDLNAAALLTRIQRPWLVTRCDWDDQLSRRAIVWLCQQTGKPILKLTNKDYDDNGLNELVVLYGSAYNCNIKVFNDIQHTITGWPGGKPNADDSNRPERANPYPKDILIFSPHPDDDVISMGGTFARLIKQNHNVHVAYETSGCIAVADENLQYFLDFNNGISQVLKNKKISTSDKPLSIQDFSSREILDIKALIRRGEATAACRYMGLDTSHIHFLNLPFYETGTIKKGDLSQRDVEIVKKLLLEIRPQEMFVAGDLADPHGTHKVCLDAVLAAIDELKDHEPWLRECRVWMYRGAWMEWDVDLIEMAVPMSPEELRSKRNAILRHQSQMESAPFMGDDERLFWQRAEDRNHATAELYTKLGLADYEAIEAFVQYRF